MDRGNPRFNRPQANGRHNSPAVDEDYVGVARPGVSARINTAQCASIQGLENTTTSCRECALVCTATLLDIDSRKTATILLMS